MKTKEVNPYITVFIDLKIGYIENHRFYFFKNADINIGDIKSPLLSYSSLIEKYSIGLLSNEFNQIFLPDLPHKLALKRGPFTCNIENQKLHSDITSEPTFFFSIDENFSVWKLTKYHYQVRDRMNTCSEYILYYDYYLDTSDSHELANLNLFIKGENLKNEFYTPLYFGCAGYRGFRFFPKNHEITKYLVAVGKTNSGEQVFILSPEAPDLSKEWDSDIPAQPTAEYLKKHKYFYLFQNLALQGGMSWPDDKDATQAQKEIKTWQDFLDSQVNNYPILFIEDNSGGFNLFIKKQNVGLPEC